MIKNLIRKLAYGYKATSESYLNHLKQIGVRVGDDVNLFGSSTILFDEQYPWLISIGNHVNIAADVKIITHDYAWSVIKTINGGIYGACGEVSIGNNVFIGMNAIITRNVHIGDNCIIGAGSVVTKDCEPNSVYAGSPARKVGG